LLYDCEQCAFFDGFVAWDGYFVFAVCQENVTSFPMNDFEIGLVEYFQKFSIGLRLAVF